MNVRGNPVSVLGARTTTEPKGRQRLRPALISRLITARVAG